MDENEETINFSDALLALADLKVPFPPRFLRSFSDLSHKNIKDLLQIWDKLPDTRKVGLLQDLDELLEKDTLVNFDVLAKSVICDANPEVRVTALGLLWECEEPRIVPMLLQILRGDPDEAVRATAASLLGRFVLLGELDSISETLKNEIVEHLIDVSTSQELSRVKQRALESLGYSSHPTVIELIRNAYDTNDISWVASALCAMGRSADDQWASRVVAHLDSPDVEVQFEAVRAAGELELISAKEKLLSLLDEDLEDIETKYAIIWSLSQIGGDEIKHKFNEMLADAVDEEEIDWLEKAIENLDLNISQGFDMMDFSSGAGDENPDLDEILDFGDEFDDLSDEEDDTDELDNR